MMVATHVLTSLGIAVVAVRHGPELLPAQLPAHLVLIAAFLGGLWPDLDVVAEHRKTLHYPAGYALLAGALATGAVATGSAPLAFGTVAVGAAALHSISDVWCGSPERAPWNPTAERAVYNHLLGGWHRPRRYVRYSGSPEDWFVGAAFGAIAIASPVTAPALDALVLALVVLSGGFALFRKRLDRLADAAARVTPSYLRARLPSLHVIERETGGTTISVRFEE